MSFVYYDIETKPDEDRAIAMFNPDKVKIGNLKDPDKIGAKIADERAKAVDRAALSPATGSIIAIGFSRGVGSDILHNDSEAALLADFWEVFREQSTFVNWTGNNGRGNFDRKWLIRRSWSLGVKIPEAAFEHSRWFDIAERFLIAEDYGTFYSLENAGRELGLEVESTDPVTGATFWKFWEDPETRAEAEKYLHQDVRLVREIFEKVN